MNVDLNWYWAHTLMKLTGKIELVHEIDLVSDHLKDTNRLLVRNQESTELTLCTFKRVCRATSQKASGKLPHLLGMTLTTDITWLFLSAVNTDISVYFIMLQMWALKLSESTNIFCTSDRTVRTIKVTIKKKDT